MRILLSAYACRPHQGSEHGLGWGWATTLAGLGHRVHVLTRRANQAFIERELAANPVPNLSFSWIDYPEWCRRAIVATAVGRRTYYHLWQLAAFGAARRLLAEQSFDVGHHVTFARYWSVSPLAFLPLPFLWGPVGGGEDAPLPHWPRLGVGGALFELARVTARRLSEFNPLLRATARRAVLAVATTPDTADRLRRLGAPRVVVASQVALSEAELRSLADASRPPPAPWRFALSGELIPLKAPHLVVGALARLPDLDWRLDIFGTGPWEGHIRRLAQDHGIGDRLVFHGWLPRRRLLAEIKACHAMIFAGLHDSGGMVCAEAMAAGLPVVALALGGAKVLLADGGGILVEAPDPGTAMSGLAETLRRLMAAPEDLPALSAQARARAAECFLWPDRARRLYALLAEARK